MPVPRQCMGARPQVRSPGRSGRARAAARRGGSHTLRRAAQVCAAAGVERSTVVYVEAHGTGTVVGDAQELGAIDRMYGAGAGRSADAPLLIGSVKSNMGHCEGCSGLAGACAPCAWHPAASCVTAPLWYPARAAPASPARPPVLPRSMQQHAALRPAHA